MQVDQIFDEQPVAGVLWVVFNRKQSEEFFVEFAGLDRRQAVADQRFSEIFRQLWAVGFDNK